MGNNRKKKSNKKPQAAAPTVEEQVIQKVEDQPEVKPVEEMKIEQPEVSFKNVISLWEKWAKLKKI